MCLVTHVNPGLKEYVKAYSSKMFEGERGPPTMHQQPFSVLKLGAWVM